MVKKGQPAVRVVHSLPHRTRLRVPRAHRDHEKMGKMKQALQSVKGVQSVDFNPATGSFLIKHDPESNVLSNLGEVLHEASEFLPLFVPELEEQLEGTSELANFMQNTFSKADDHFARATDNFVDLKMIVPIVLGIEGIRRVMQTGSLLGEVSPFVLLYYAFDSYWKMHGAKPIAEANPSVRQFSKKT